MTKKECEAINNWCKENNVTVKLHNNSLTDTCNEIFDHDVSDKLTVKASFS